MLDAVPTTSIERTILVRSRWYDHDKGRERTSAARLVVAVRNREYSTIPGEITTQESPVDGVKGYHAYATGVRYHDLADFLRKWGAVPVRPA
jgi:hypothetical protein